MLLEQLAAAEEETLAAHGLRAAERRRHRDEIDEVTESLEAAAAREDRLAEKVRRPRRSPRGAIAASRALAMTPQRPLATSASCSAV